MRVLSSFLVSGVLLLTSVVSATAQSTASGHWEGALVIQGKDVSLDFDLAANEKGVYAGVVNIPAHDVKSVPLANFAIVAPAVAFQITQSTPGDNAFKATMTADGSAMSGVFTHDVYTMNFTVKRTGDARITAPAVSTAVTPALEGTWTGSVSSDGTTRGVALTLKNEADGSASGSVTSLEKHTTFAIASIVQQGSTLTLDVRAAGGVYSGTVNAAGTEINGEWIEGEKRLPLVFRRGQ
jgi:hypothetical protein